MVGLDIWISQPERKSYIRSEKFCPHHSPCSKCFYFNKPKTVKKCKKGVYMTCHVYTITCKQNEKMYIAQSVNSTRRFKQHALNIPTKMIIDVHRYKPFEKCFESKFFFSSYKKYSLDCEKRKLISKFQTTQNRHGYNMNSCDCEKRKLISKFQTTQNRHGYNLLKLHPTSDTRYWRLYRRIF
jgi:hypothetical protein